METAPYCYGMDSICRGTEAEKNKEIQQCSYRHAYCNELSQDHYGKGFFMQKYSSRNGITRVISINRGMPSSGKTAFATNLAVDLARKEKKVLLFNLDIKSQQPGGTAYHAGNLIKKECRLEDAIISGPCGLEIIQSWPENEEPAALSTVEKINLMSALEDFGKKFDFIIIDIGNGWSETGLFMNILASEMVFISTPDRESIIETCSLMRVLCGLGEASFKLAINKVKSKKEGLDAYELASELANGTPASVSYLGSITHDENFKKAAEKGLPITISNPESVASINYGEIADWLCIEPVRSIRGGIQLFWQEGVRLEMGAPCERDDRSSAWT